MLPRRRLAENGAWLAFLLVTVAAGGTCLAVGGGKFYEFLCRESPFSGLRTLRNRESAGTLGGMGVEPAIKVSGSGTSGGSGFSASG
jgi:hypothetical protein